MKKTTLTLMVAAALAAAFSPVHADSIVYTGNAADLKDPPGSSGGSNMLYPGSQANPAASGNTLWIDYDPHAAGVAHPSFVFGGFHQSATGSTDASGNAVTMVNGRVSGSVIGGFASSSSGTATASHNTVTINSGSVSGSVIGGYAGSSSGNATASHNTVTINSGSVSDEVIGGYAESSSGTAPATASHNTVTIKGGSVSGNVIGGYAYSSGSGNATATHNTVTIGEAATLSSTTRLFGGDGSGMSIDLFTGNTLNIAGRHAVDGIVNFQTLNFTLANDMAAGETLVSADTVALGGGSTDSTIGRVGIAGGGTPFAVGDSVTLLNASTLFSGNISNDGGTATGMKGMSLIYEWDIAKAGNAITAMATRVGLNPQTHALLSGRAAQTALLNQGADLVAGRGMASMKLSADSGNGSFFAMQAGSSRYKTGSGIDMDSFSMMAGATWGMKLYADTRLALGAFVETGTGSYNSSNSFNNMPSVRGSGNTDYIGVGVLGSIEWANGFYADASLRGGRVESDLSTSVYNYGERGEYDEASSLYLGAHAGVGYNWHLSSVDTLDMYTRYLWTYTDSDSVTVLGDKYHFDSANSHRCRTGLKYGRTMGRITPYAGLAYEFEFDGKAGGKVYGYDLKQTDMGGSTFIGEFGLSWLPTSKDNISLDVALEGFAGQRDGVMGNVRFHHRF